MSVKLHSANMALKAYTGSKVLKATANYFRTIASKRN